MSYPGEGIIGAASSGFVPVPLEERDRHIRAFNSLEKAVTKHTDECPDCEDLKRAHRIVMRMLAERKI